MGSMTPLNHYTQGQMSGNKAYIISTNSGKASSVNSGTNPYAKTGRSPHNFTNQKTATMSFGGVNVASQSKVVIKTIGSKSSNRQDKLTVQKSSMTLRGNA